MRAIYSRFSYISDGVLKGSDEFGMVCVSFTTSSSKLHAGQASKLTTEKAADSMDWEIISQDYSSPISFTMQLCRVDFGDISPEQERTVSKFLCRRGEYGWLFIQNKRYADIYMKANFSNPQVLNINGADGLQYTVTLSSAVAYTREFEHEINITSANGTYELRVNNDEQYLIYPAMDITMKQAGTLTISNDLEETTDYVTTLSGLSNGEIINIDNDLPNLKTSSSSHNIWDDFNLHFPRLYDGINTLKFSLPCSVDMRYREYRKLVIY